MVTAKLERNPSRVLLQQYWPLGVVFFWGKRAAYWCASRKSRHVAMLRLSTLDMPVVFLGVTVVMQ